MRSLASLAIAVGAVLALASAPALAAVKVPGTSATFAWTPPAEPVATYRVEVSRNGGNYEQEKTVSAPQATVTGNSGDKLRIRVAACAATGNCSQPSKPSTKVKFVSPNQAGAAASDDKGAKEEKRNDWVDLPPPPPAVPLVQGAMPYDFNGDSRTDLLWRNRRTMAVAVWLMNGAAPPSIVDLGVLEKKWEFLGSGDFDGDGQADLLLLGGRQGYEIWFMNGGQVRNAVPFEGPGSGYRKEAIGDFDGDGYADLLWRKGKNSLFWFMRGWTVDQAVAGPVIKRLSPAVCTPDLDGDGRSDVVWSGSKETAAWLMAGSSPWRSGPVGPKMKKYDPVGCGDADGDGFGDVLWYSKKPGGLLWVMNGNLGIDLSLELPQLEAGWIMEASGDFDGQGLANEILVRDTKTGAIEVWKLLWNSQRTSFTVESTAGAGMGSKDWEVVAP